MSKGCGGNPEAAIYNRHGAPDEPRWLDCPGCPDCYAVLQAKVERLEAELQTLRGLHSSLLRNGGKAIEVSAEFLDKLKADWSDAVEVKIEDGELIFRNSSSRERLEAALREIEEVGNSAAAITARTALTQEASNE